MTKTEIHLRQSLWNTGGRIVGDPLLPSGDSGERSADGTVEKDEIMDLLYGAEYAIRPERGFFFESMGENPEMLVVGFSVPLPKKFAKRGEIYYHLFSMRLSAAEGVSLSDLIETLSAVKENTNNKLPEYDRLEGLPLKTLDRGVRRSETVPRGEITRRAISNRTDRPLSREHPHNTFAGSSSSGRGSSDPSQGVGDGDPTDHRSERSGGDEPTDHQPQRSGNAEPPEGISDRSKDPIIGDNDQRRIDHGQPVDRSEILEAVALLWEDFRRNPGTDPLRATLDEIDLFTTTVEGSLRHLAYASKLAEEDLDLDYFNVVGGECRQKHDHADTYRKIRNIDDETATLHWNDLPKFEDELHRHIETHRRHLGVDPRESIEALSGSDGRQDPLGELLAEAVGPSDEPNTFYADLWRAFFEAYLAFLKDVEPKLRRDLEEQFRRVIDPNRSLETEDESGLGGKLKGSLEGGLESFQTDDGGTIGIDPTEIGADTVSKTDTIDRTEATAIAESVVESNRETIGDAIDNRIREELAADVESHTEERLEELLVDLFERTDSVKETEAYERTDDDSVWPS